MLKQGDTARGCRCFARPRTSPRTRRGCASTLRARSRRAATRPARKRELEHVAERDPQRAGQAKPSSCWAAVSLIRPGTPSRPKRHSHAPDPAARASRSPTNQVVAVVGLGYVGLPLAVEFGKRYPNHRLRPVASEDRRVPAVVDPTGEVSAAELQAVDRPVGDAPTRRARARPTSSSSPCRRRSTTRTSRTSVRCSARASRSAAT